MQKMHKTTSQSGSGIRVCLLGVFGRAYQEKRILTASDKNKNLDNLVVFSHFCVVARKGLASFSFFGNKKETLLASQKLIIESKNLDDCRQEDCSAVG